jgi:hypothetical protein
MKMILPIVAATLVLVWGCTKEPTPPAPLSAEQQALVLQRGRGITAETFALLSSNLQSAIKTSGVSNALPFCSLSASPLTAGMAARHGVNIRRFSQKPRNPAARADAAELAVLKSFEMRLSARTDSNPPPPFVTNFTAATATFFAPIVLNNALCLQCHGEPGREIAPENLAVIQRLYPHDEATGFKPGDLRGAWRIDMPVPAK